MADSRSRSHRRGRRGSRANFDRRERDSSALPTHSQERRHSGRHHRSRSPTTNGRGGQPNPFNIHAMWVGDSTHYDIQKEYGLKLPRRVESCQFTRRVNLASTELTDIRLYETLSLGSNNWALRLLANGRYVTFEAFRTRVDATFASILCREIYKDDSLDFNAIIQQFNQERNDDWNQKMLAN